MDVEVVGLTSHGGQAPDTVAAEIQRRASGRFNLSPERVQRYAGGIAEGRRVHVAVDTSNLK